MPPLSTDPKGVFEPPRSILEANIPDWLEMATYITKLMDIDTAVSTGELVLEYLPENVFLEGIYYRLVTPFAAASDDLFPEIWFGDTANHRRYGGLRSENLVDTEFFGGGYIPIGFMDTSTGGGTLTAYVHYASGETVGTGLVELWLKYRARADRDSKRGKKAK